jgi:hypothetical protein
MTRQKCRSSDVTSSVDPLLLATRNRAFSGCRPFGDRANRALVGRIEHGERAGIGAIGGHVAQHFGAQAAAAHARAG